MPKAFPAEFRRDVVAVARKGEAPISQIAEDFGISESCLHRWLNLADIEDGVRPGVTVSESAEVRELKNATGCWSRRSRSCAAQRPTSRKTSPQMTYPLVLELAADGIGRHADLPGARLLSARLLPVEGQPGHRPGLG